MEKSKYNNNSNHQFAKRMTKLMDIKKTQGGNQQDVADYIGVTRQSISQYCNGNSFPTADKVILLAEYFGVSADYLLGISDIKSVNADLQSTAAYLGVGENIVNNLKNIIDGFRETDKECGEGYLDDKLIALEFLFKSPIILNICEHITDAKVRIDISEVHKELGKPYDEDVYEERKGYSEFILYKSMIKELEKIIVDMPHLYTIDDYNFFNNGFEVIGDTDG